MRNFGVVFVAVLCLLGGCSEAQKFTSADDAKIRSELDGWVKAFRAKEWTKVAAYYTDDAVLLPSNAKAVAGRKGIEAFLTGFPPTEGMTLKVDEIRGDGDLAIVRGTYSMKIPIPVAPEPVSEVGKFIEVRVRGDGSWRISHDIFNSDLPAR